MAEDRGMEAGSAADRGGDTGAAGAPIRLCQQARLRLDPACPGLLFTADRIDRLTREGRIRSWLERGHHVLCARYWLFSYATLLDQVELDWLRAIDAPCLLPDGTLFIDAPPVGPAEDGARLRKNHLRVVEALQGDGYRILHIDGGLPLDEIQHECQRELGDWLNTDDAREA